ncbi:MAG: NAD-dependent epimerase/dehydratase family protein [Bacteroidota bacterium]|nr:NAD-dependent epimerase/dehydratase family protein [Bacteroidota bacterium]
MKKVFVTGADGMLGSNICRELIKQGFLVKAFCLPNKTITTLNGLSIEIAHGDVLSKPMLFNEMKGCDFVIHVAALTNIWPRRNYKVNEVNLTGTKNVMEAAEELKITRMVHIGSASSFEHGSNKNPGNELLEFNGWKYGMDYLESKYLAQKLLLEKHASTGFPVIIINPTFMIGAFDSGPSSGQMIISLFKETIPGYTSGGKNFVCSTDVACAVVNALYKGKIGECYIAGNENLKFKEFFTKAATVMGKKFKLKQIPQPLVLLVGAINSFISRITFRTPSISYGMAKFASINQCFSSLKAVNELNMPQTPIEDGIKDCFEWFKTNGYL